MTDKTTEARKAALARLNSLIEDGPDGKCLYAEGHYGYGAYVIFTPEEVETIRAALQEPSGSVGPSPNELPELPDGWIMVLENYGAEWFCRVSRPCGHPIVKTNIQSGPTPRAAAEAAIEKIKKDNS